MVSPDWKRKLGMSKAWSWVGQVVAGGVGAAAGVDVVWAGSEAGRAAARARRARVLRSMGGVYADEG